MKKFLAFTMAAAMTLSLAACGGGSSSGSNTSADGSGSAAFKLGGTGPLTGAAPRSLWRRSMPRAAPSSSS